MDKEYEYHIEERLGGFEMSEDDIGHLADQGWELYSDPDEVNGFDPSKPALREGQVGIRYTFRREKRG